MSSEQTKPASRLERRLPGEPENSTDPDDLRLWSDVYTELAGMLARLSRVPSPGVDQNLQRHIDWLERRRDEWTRRRHDLRAS